MFAALLLLFTNMKKCFVKNVWLAKNIKSSSFPKNCLFFPICSDALETLTCTTFEGGGFKEKCIWIGFGNLILNDEPQNREYKNNKTSNDIIARNGWESFMIAIKFTENIFSFTRISDKDLDIVLSKMEKDAHNIK